ncbi:NEP-like protein, partial [Mya arenaria]
TKGFVNLNQTDSIRFEGANDKYHSSDVTHAYSTSPCTTPKPTEPERCKDDICARLSADILVKMNVTADPCQDFYEYACGGFERSTQLSWNTPRKRTNPDIVLENYQDAISDRLSEDVKPTDGREVKAIKRVFQSCLGFQRNTHRE